MGFIRGTLFIIVSILLFFSLIGTGIFYMVNLSLEPEIVQSHLVNSTNKAVREIGVYDNFVESFEMIQSECDKIGFYEFNIDYEILNVDCENLSSDVDEAYYNNLGNFVMNSYYNDYNCSIWDCLKETGSPSFLISKKTKDYAYGKFYFFLLVSLALIGAMFFLVEKKSSFPIIVGGFLSVVSFIFLKIDSFVPTFEDKLVLSFVSIFLTRAYGVFAKFIFFGILFILIGLIWKFAIFGFKVKKVIDWFKEWKKNHAKAKAEKLKEEKKVGKKNKKI